MPLEDAAMPAEIREAGGLGTMVVFLGDGEDDDTTRPPHGETGERWLRKAINQRFYELPDWAVVKVREIRNAGDQSAVNYRQSAGAAVLPRRLYDRVRHGRTHWRERSRADPR